MGPAPVASSTALAGNEPVCAATDIDHQCARDARAVTGRHQLDRAVLLEAAHVESEHLLHHPVDDFDAGQVALVDRTVETLARERLQVDRPVGVAVEEAPDFVFEFVNAFDRAFYEPPRQILA